MALAGGKHKIFHKSYKNTVFFLEILNVVCKLNLSYLNIPQVFECLLTENLI